MEAQPGFETACSIHAQWGIRLHLWKMSIGLGVVLAFCGRKRWLSTEAGRQPDEALGSNMLCYFSIVRKILPLLVVNYLRFPCEPLTVRKHKWP